MFFSTANRIVQSGLSFIKTWDPQGHEALLAFKGHQVGVTLKGLPPFSLVWDHQTLRIEPKAPINTLECTTSPAWLLSYIISQKSQARRHIRLEGDVLFAQELEQVVHALDIVPEDLFSHVLGDKYAHPIYLSVRKLFKMAKHQPLALSQSLSDYLCFETGQIVSPSELSHFGEEIDTLVADTDRLEARIRALKELIC